MSNLKENLKKIKRKNLYVSNWTIVTYIEILNKYFLLHGYSNAIALVSKRIGEIIINKEITYLTDEEFSYLLSNYFITEASLRDEINEIKKAYDKFDQIYFKDLHANFLIIFSYDYSFNCVYCYEKNLLKKGKKWIKKRICKEDFNKILLAMKKINLDETRSSITYYGGEPLMKENYDIVCYATDKLMEKGYKGIDIITNGYEIELYEKYFGYPFVSMQITIDGLPETHNKRRYTKNGQGSFNKTIDNISIALNKNVRIRLRVNIDNNNLFESEELYKVLKEKGFIDNKNFSYYISPIDKELLKGNLTYYSLKKIVDTQFNEKIDTNIMHKEIESNIYSCLKTKSPYIFKTTSCAANKNMYIFDPFLDIYPCWDFVGLEEHKIGSINNDIILYNNKRFCNKKLIKEIEECLTCKYLLFYAIGYNSRTYNEAIIQKIAYVIIKFF